MDEKPNPKAVSRLRGTTCLDAPEAINARRGVCSMILTRIACKKNWPIDAPPAASRRDASRDRGMDRAFRDAEALVKGSIRPVQQPVALHLDGGIALARRVS